jgi:hypothetical protein
MAKTKIRRDTHGLYLRTDGRLYRPQPVPDSGSVASGASYMREGETINASHPSGCCFAILRDRARDVKEFWYDHGTYYGVNGIGNIPSDLLWKA